MRNSNSYCIFCCTGESEYGGMIPSTATPFAMTRWTPYTNENYISTCPYVYGNSTFHGFLGTHQPAVWMGESGQVAISAGSGPVKTDFLERGLQFSHGQEISMPHYYKVVVNGSADSSIVAELTATSRASYIQFTFDSIAASSFVAVEVTRAYFVGNVFIDTKKREISGWNPERQDSKLGPFTASGFKGYFVARFDEDFDSWGTVSDSAILPDSLHRTGPSLSAYVTFPSNIKRVHVRVGVSYISIDQARQNIDNEIPDGATLEDTAKAVEKLWADKLDLVEITNATEDEKTIFYTAMYHALQVELSYAPQMQFTDPHYELMKCPSCTVPTTSLFVVVSGCSIRMK